MEELRYIERMSAKAAEEKRQAKTNNLVLLVGAAIIGAILLVIYLNT